MIQFSISTQFKCQSSSISNNSVQHQYTVLFAPMVGPIRCYHSGLEWNRVIAINGYSVFPKTPSDMPIVYLLPRSNTDWLRIISVLRCSWCNGYRRRKWTRRHEFKSWTRLIAFHIALIPLGKVWIQLFSL